MADKLWEYISSFYLSAKFYCIKISLFTKENICTLHLDSIKSNKVMMKNKKNGKHLTFNKLVV